MSEPRCCLYFRLRDGRTVRSFVKFIERYTMDYVAFPMYQTIIVPCAPKATTRSVLDEMPFRLASKVAVATRKADMKEIVVGCVRGGSPYQTWRQLLVKARLQGALISKGLVEILED